MEQFQFVQGNQVTSNQVTPVLSLQRQPNACSFCKRQDLEPDVLRGKEAGVMSFKYPGGTIPEPVSNNLSVDDQPGYVSGPADLLPHVRRTGRVRSIKTNI